jgi:hypothetical protein
MPFYEDCRALVDANFDALDGAEDGVRPRL